MPPHESARAIRAPPCRMPPAVQRAGAQAMRARTTSLLASVSSISSVRSNGIKSASASTPIGPCSHGGDSCPLPGRSTAPGDIAGVMRTGAAYGRRMTQPVRSYECAEDVEQHHGALRPLDRRIVTLYLEL